MAFHGHRYAATSFVRAVAPIEGVHVFMRCPLAASLLLVFAAQAAVVSEEVIIEGAFLKLEIAPEDGAPIEHLSLTATGNNSAGDGGLLQEGFGVPSYYMPSRRVNETLEVLEMVTDRPVLRYSYDCDGPNIQGLHVTRTMEPLPNEASVRVTWRIENRGQVTQWVAPWVRNAVRAGGSHDSHDRIDVPAFEGILQATDSGWHAAARNWIAVTDPVAQETFYAVFHVDHTHSFLVLRDDQTGESAVQTAFVPRAFPPGSAWETKYRINMVRGLKHVDFATDELAAQIEYTPGKVDLLIAPVKPLPPMHIHATIVGPDGESWKLPAKSFEISPTRLTRCTYEWTAPHDGPYEFLAQLLIAPARAGVAGEAGVPFDLGEETSSPHGGIDLQFVVGAGRREPMEAWSEAPYALDRGGRELKRPLLHDGAAQVWAEPSSEKLDPMDYVTSTGPAESAVRVQLARNEYESFQLVLRPITHSGRVAVEVNRLTHIESGYELPPGAVTVYNVAHVPVTVPSHFESASGLWPDPLPPFTPFTAAKGRSYPVWFTIYAPADAPPGMYKGAIEVNGLGLEPIELWLEVEVFDFALPETPAMKTDFGFWVEGAIEQCRAKGYTGSNQLLLERYRDNALAHRVTLRELTAFPEPRPGYEAALREHTAAITRQAAAGATTFAVPLELLNAPETLTAANAFVRDHGLATRAFAQLATAPLEPAWPRVLEAAAAWKLRAPDIPLMVTTQGLNAFLPPDIDIWAVHSQLMDTHHGHTIIERIRQGGEVWWHVNELPSRPYANLLLDFPGVEHRALFWQAWAMGASGFHYGGINFSKPGTDPWKTQVDLTPAQGDGFLVYPGPDGPVNSIRWELVRDGLEDCDYLALLRERIVRLQAKGTQPELVARAANVYHLGDVTPNLVSFPRDIQRYLAKREAIARMIVELDRAG
jgi:hypothetical protein